MKRNKEEKVTGKYEFVEISRLASCDELAGNFLWLLELEIVRAMATGLSNSP